MGIKRIGKHLLAHRWRVRRLFPAAVLAAIEQAIKAGEATHAGQVRFVVEGALDGAPLFRDQSARQRASTSSRNCASGTPRTTTAS